jgi:hypothetical protein
MRFHRLLFQMHGGGYWRMGCTPCEGRVDLADRVAAEKYAIEHNDKYHEGRAVAKVYRPTWLRRFLDHVIDSE